MDVADLGFHLVLVRGVVRYVASERTVDAGERAFVRSRACVRLGDERIEALTPVQKQLLRLGPDNLRIVQRQVRAIATALGLRMS